MSEFMTPAQAIQYLNVSRFIFNENIRPELTEIRHGPRTVRFDKIELDRYLEHSGGMLKKKKVSDALEHAWKLKWDGSRGRLKKKSLMDLVDREIGDVPLSRLDYNRIEQWVMEMMEADKAVATIKARLSCLKFALKLVAKKGWIPAVPEFPELEVSPKRLRWLKDTPDEEQALMDACGVLAPEHEEVMRWAIVFLLDTGCRLSELVKLRIDGVSTAGALFEERKAGDSLRVPLTDEARKAIESLLSNRTWARRVRGAEVDKKRCESAVSWFSHEFAKVRDEAKLYDVTVHTLRHTCASRLVQAGVSLYEVRQLLGHSSITVTERYAHLAPSSLDRAMAVLTNRRLPDKVAKMRRDSH